MTRSSGGRVRSSSSANWADLIDVVGRLDTHLELRAVRLDQVAERRVADGAERLDPVIPRLPLAVGIDHERVQVRGVAVDVGGHLEHVPNVAALLRAAFGMLDEPVEQVLALRDPGEVQRVVVRIARAISRSLTRGRPSGGRRCGSSRRWPRRAGRWRRMDPSPGPRRRRPTPGRRPRRRRSQGTPDTRAAGSSRGAPRGRRSRPRWRAGGGSSRADRRRWP